MVVQTILRNALGYTLTATGAEFKQTNASAFHAITVVKNLYTTSSEFKDKYDQILLTLFENAQERNNIIERMLDENRKEEKTYRDIYNRFNPGGKIYIAELPDHADQSSCYNTQKESDVCEIADEGYEPYHTSRAGIAKTA
jgi:hypothetical protein